MINKEHDEKEYVYAYIADATINGLIDQIVEFSKGGAIRVGAITTDQVKDVPSTLYFKQTMKRKRK